MLEPEDDIDLAYRAAVQALHDDAAAQRRRAAVLAAVQAASLPAEAANEAQWRPGRRSWGGLAAACVIGLSTLVVQRLADEPVVPAEAPTASPATPPAAAAQRLPAPEAAPPMAAPKVTAPGPAATANADTAADSAAAPPATTPSKLMRGAATERGSDETPATAAPPPPPPPVSAAAAPADTRIEAPTGRALENRVDPPRRLLAPAAAPALRSANRGALAVDSLLAAVAAGNDEAARRLLTTVDPDDERDAEGRTALALAVQRSDARLVALLLARGADPALPDRHGQTPMDLARALNDAAVLDALKAR